MSASRFKRGEILHETFKFIQPKIFLDTWLFKENFIYFQMYLPKGKWASQMEKLPLDAKQSIYLFFYLDLSSWRGQDD